MTAPQLRQYLQNAPLTLHLGSGRKFRVPHTDYAHVSPNGKFVIVYGATPDDIFEIVGLKDIESVTMKNPKNQSAA